MYITLLIIFAIAAAVAFCLLPHVVTLSHTLHLYDMPDSRKVHVIPVPRLGGSVFLPIATIVITAALVVLMRFDYNLHALWNSVNVQHFLAYLCGAMSLYAIGLYDDIHGVGYRTKFLVQAGAAAILCVSGLWISDLSYIFYIHRIAWWIGMPLTMLFVVYVTNAINLIDGIDGLASGLSIIALVVMTILNIQAGSMLWAMLATAYLGVVIVFFGYNVYGSTHKTFMGDAGSLTLGYTLAFLVLHFWQDKPVWNPYFHNVGIVAMSTLILPMFDVVRVFLSRIRDHRNPFLPDKNHIHHKLLRAGLSPFMTMVTLLVISCVIIAINYVMASYVSQTLMIIIDVAIYCLMHVCINIAIFRKEKDGEEYNRAY